MFSLALVLLPLSCRKDEDPIISTPDTGPGPCELETWQYAAGEATRTRHPNCGELLLDEFEVQADGTLRLELFTDGQRVIPSLQARGGDVAFRSLHMWGRWVVEGAGPARTWGLGYTADLDPGVLDVASVELDADGLPRADGPGTSWWAGVVGRVGGPAALVGTHTSWQAAPRISFDASGTLHVVWDSLGEDVLVREGQLLYLDPLYMAVGPDPAELLGAWAAAVALSSAGPEIGDPPPVSWRVPATSSSEVLDALDALPPDAPVEALLVEPSGSLDLAALPDLISATGLSAGVRVSPASVQAVEARVAEGWDLLELDVSELRALSVVSYRAELQALVGAAAGVPVVVAGGPQLPSVGIAPSAEVGPVLAAANGSWWWNVPEPIVVDGALDDVARGGVARSAVVGGAWSGVGDPSAAAAVLPTEVVSARDGSGAAVAALDRLGTPTVWILGDLTALLNESASEIEVQGPGGREILTGEEASAGARRLAPGAGELWR